MATKKGTCFNYLTLLAALAYLCSQGATAANWLDLQGNEPPGAKPLTFWGFVQPTYTYNDGGPVNGLSGAANITAYNGQTPLFNLVAPDNEHRDQLQISRARFGARGVIPGTNEKINYFLLTEFGNNGLTRENLPVVTDASLSFHYIPNARIRAGLFKAPLGEEALQAIHVFDYINFSAVTDNLALERFVSPASTTRPINVPTGLAAATVVDAVGAFRDVGVQVYDSFRRDKWEYAYAVMVGNGNGINFDDNNSSLDLTARLQTAYIFGGKGPRRQDVTAYVWAQEGKRTFGGIDYDRSRVGTGFKYVRAPFRVSGEYMQGKGMIFNGANPPFNDIGTGFQPVATVGLGSNNKADGFYLEGGWSINKQWELDLRYDELNRLTNSGPDERKFSTWTLGVQYFFTPAMRLTFNYEIRDIKVANPGALAAGPARNNAEAIANSIGDRAAVQFTWIF